MSLILSVAVVLLLICQLYFYATEKPRNSPPGPPKLPFWGSYWFLLWGDYRFPYKTISYYVKKYKSKILSVYLGTGTYGYVIVVNDYETIKEVLTRKEFDGRMRDGFVSMSRAFGKVLGVFFNDDAEWLVQRRFALRNLRDFGFGRRHQQLESCIGNQVEILVDILKNGPRNEFEKTVVKDGSAYFPDVLFPSCANPIWSVMSGETYEREDYEKLRKLCRFAMMFQRGGDTMGGAVSQTPWLRHFGEGFGFHTIMKGSYGMVDFAKAFVNKRKASPNGENEAKGFMDVYLKRLKEGEPDNGFSEEQLLLVVVDVMFPALSAVPSTLTHIVKRMMHHPEVRKKVQREIDHVVGRSRLPEWNDRINLPYTEATIREALRVDTLTPLGVTHRATEATTLSGYNVPYNTPVMLNLAAMHTDPELWGDPEVFRPERFLTEDGQRLAKDYSLPFGFGRRVCAGETFSRFIIFMHFAALMQNFHFDHVHGQPTKVEDVLPGLIISPKDAWIRVSSR